MDVVEITCDEADVLSSSSMDTLEVFCDEADVLSFSGT